MTEGKHQKTRAKRALWWSSLKNQKAKDDNYHPEQNLSDKQ